MVEWQALHITLGLIGSTILRAFDSFVPVWPSRHIGPVMRLDLFREVFDNGLTGSTLNPFAFWRLYDLGHLLLVPELSLCVDFGCLDLMHIDISRTVRTLLEYESS